MQRYYATLFVILILGTAGNVVVPSQSRAEETQPAAKVDYVTQIRPILEERCYSCHGPEKQKSKLRLDQPDAITQGGEEGPAVVPNKPEDSPLYRRITLPPDHDDFMPQKGPPLSPEQIALIRAWIEQGAVFTVSVAQAPADAAAAFAARQEPSRREPDILDVLAQGVSAPNEEAVQRLRNFGAYVVPLSAESPLLQVSFENAARQTNDDTLALIEPLAPNIAWLNLAGTGITDDGMRRVATLRNLTHLHLERTSISDAGLATLSGLEHLQYLNVYGTRVTDAGLEALASLKNLRSLYVWRTQVTPAGASQLQARLPQVHVDLGRQGNVATPATPSKEDIATPSPSTSDQHQTKAGRYDPGSCCEKAAAVQKACDHPCCVEAEKAGKVCAACNPMAASRS